MPIGVAVAADHARGSRPGEQAWKPSQRPKRSRERDLLLDRLGRVHPGLALVLDHLARHQVAPVRGGVEHDVVGPPLDAAVEHRLQRLVVAVVLVEARGRRRTAGSAGPSAAQQRRAAGRSTAGPRGAARSASAGRAPPRAASACAALTRLDLPMPRAPQSSTLLAGKPRANCRVLASSVSRARSMPTSSADVDPRDPRHRLQPVGPGRARRRPRRRRGRARAAAAGSAARAPRRSAPARGLVGHGSSLARLGGRRPRGPGRAARPRASARSSAPAGSRSRRADRSRRRGSAATSRPARRHDRGDDQHRDDRVLAEAAESPLARDEPGHAPSASAPPAAGSRGRRRS